ncbi:probable S-adenosylmethionine-dependent methyltransferase At5g38100 [Eucalyptus grandis]|uniref:probable S-adenosylmethionine-dependent methyltransferase At5g38100 n=1 Tax=Eucalyptus grandis TaxID=71139 RepID=UPI00192EB950|nr:probable S-adenosylmethionine-dependent methyltransferase At5g38100 [Eucalyptus grandis]
MEGSSNAFPMNGGEGPHSYSRNSSGQRIFIERARKLIQEAVAEHLDIEAFSSSGAFLVADLGCSVGPNTLYAEFQKKFRTRAPAWNKGRIFYPSASEEVIKAYAAQFAKDMEVFLRARAQEIVLGGLMMLTCVTRRDGALHSEAFANRSLDLLESCLVDMVKKGNISEERMDEFNLPMYYASPQEMKEAVERNGHFSIKKMVELFEGSAEAYP